MMSSQEAFIREVAGYLEEAHKTLQGGMDPEALYSLLRSVHSVKGVAGFLYFEEISKCAHAVEDLLDLAVANKIAADDAFVAVMGTALLFLAQRCSTPAERRDLTPEAQSFIRWIEKICSERLCTKIVPTDVAALLQGVPHKRVDEVQEASVHTFEGLFEDLRVYAESTARELGKEIRVAVESGDFSVEGELLQSLKAPLIHLVHNALVHGIETPELRLRRDKPTEGTMWLRATRSGTELCVEVRDDGGGIDEDAVRAQFQGCPEADVRSMILEPGVSTTPEVSKLSGRGVGLDSVRATLEGLGASLLIDSLPQKGFSCTLRIKLKGS